MHSYGIQFVTILSIFGPARRNNSVWTGDSMQSEMLDNVFFGRGFRSPDFDGQILHHNDVTIIDVLESITK